MTLRRQVVVPEPTGGCRKFVILQSQTSRRETVPRFFHEIGCSVFRKAAPCATVSPHRAIGTRETAKQAAVISDGAFCDSALPSLRATMAKGRDDR
jgi:hypothetical protein